MLVQCPFCFESFPEGSTQILENCPACGARLPTEEEQQAAANVVPIRGSQRLLAYALILGTLASFAPPFGLLGSFWYMFNKGSTFCYCVGCEEPARVQRQIGSESHRFCRAHADMVPRNAAGAGKANGIGLIVTLSMALIFLGWRYYIVAYRVLRGQWSMAPLIASSLGVIILINGGLWYVAHCYYGYTI